MQRFKVSKIDVSVEIEIEGEVITLEKVFSSAKEVSAFSTTIGEMEVPSEGEKEVTGPMAKIAKVTEVMDKQLCFTYGKEEGWFLDRLDHGTMKEMIEYIVGKLFRYDKENKN